MGMDVGGPSAAQLHSMAGDQGKPPDTGQAMGGQLEMNRMNYQQRYAEPGIPPQKEVTVTTGVGPGVTQAPEYYNYQPMLPAKYNVPTFQKERMATRQEIRKAAGSGLSQNVVRTDAITDEEVDYLQSMKDQAELADFDRYVNSLIDPRKPGNLKWLMEIYPDFVNRRIQQVSTDYEYALRNQMIDSWGINTFDDLHFKYLVDQGRLKGPSLRQDGLAPGNYYNAGVLSPMYLWDIRKSGIRLPFASAKYGRSAATEDAWTMADEVDGRGNPLAANRLPNQLAKAMYQGVQAREDPTAPEQRLATAQKNAITGADRVPP